VGGAREDDARSAGRGARGSVIGGAVVALLLAVATLRVDFALANRKLFWADEENALTETCAQRYSQLLTRGARGQCSPEPLYHLLQKAYLKRLATNDNILWTHRLLSLASAAGCVALSVAASAATLGIPAALVGGLALVSEPLFHRFART